MLLWMISMGFTSIERYIQFSSDTLGTHSISGMVNAELWHLWSLEQNGMEERHRSGGSHVPDQSHTWRSADHSGELCRNGNWCQIMLYPFIFVLFCFVFTCCLLWRNCTLGMFEAPCHWSSVRWCFSVLLCRIQQRNLARALRSVNRRRCTSFW